MSIVIGSHYKDSMGRIWKIETERPTTTFEGRTERWFSIRRFIKKTGTYSAQSYALTDNSYERNIENGSYTIVEMGG
jgi:hypothetical protein